MRIYLDVCCLNRPFDDQLQHRIRVEAEAVRVVLQRIHAGELTWVSSEACDFEVHRNPDQLLRETLSDLMLAADESVRLSPAIVERANELVSSGFSNMDGLHLACAEAGACDILLTVDDRFLKRCARQQPPLRVRALNPVSWLVEPSDGR